ncbi:MULTISPECIES: hypothetical protein [unclassified Mesorhizobium]|uniref:hypothetical protein n=1 Tax=unclassified Mesorhizobium TaxID=325217 RepID=UPI001596BBED|nr:MULTISPECIES: hypothetical protein [unclassified Mesorhizobium]
MLQTAERLENEGFEDLVEGSKISLEQLRDHALNNCYLMAERALELGLVADIAR